MDVIMDYRVHLATSVTSVLLMGDICRPLTVISVPLTHVE